MCACGAGVVSGWKPGDVLVRENGALLFVVGHVPVDRGSELYTGPCVVDTDGNGWKFDSDRARKARPLVVIDPEDAEAIRRLLAAILDQNDPLHPDGSGLAAALREFADPNPRIKEPLGWGAVVEDNNGWYWTSLGPESGLWANAAEHVRRRWCDLNVVRVVSEGVPS